MDEKSERLRRRQEQLAKWKLKKQQDAKDSTSTESTPGESRESTPKEVSESERKKLERQRKLEEWKRRKQQELQKVDSEKQPSPETVPVSTSTNDKRGMRIGGLKTGKAGIFPKKPVIRLKRVFGEDGDGDEPEPQFKKPVLKSNYNRGGNSQADDDTEIDALDAFVQELGQTSDNPVDDVIGEEDSDTNEDSEEEGDGEAGQLAALQRQAMQKGKSLAAIDHEQIAYEPFRKNFYVEATEVSELSDEQVADLRANMDGIKVSGTSSPRPIWKWNQLGLSPVVTALVEEQLGFSTPTPVQAQAIPAIMAGNDVLTIAKTGSGKTLAFVLPLLKHVTDQKPLDADDGPVAVLLAPTRELAVQIHRQLSIFTKKLGLSSCCCYGGASIEPQISEMRKGVHVAVATPGRLIDLLAANNGRVTNLRRTTYVVVDEADRMFDFGFEPQLKKIFAQIRPDKQCVLFLATFARKMESLAKQTLQNPVQIVVGGIGVVAKEISQHIELFERDNDQDNVQEERFPRLVEILRQFSGKKLVFVERQDACDDLLVRLLRIGIPSLAIHGGKDQLDRKHAISEFASANSAVDVLIATSVAARGLDVQNLRLVVNYDPPSHLEDYVHRVGRTGRAGSAGDAYTFVFTDQERAIADLVKALVASGENPDTIDRRLLEISQSFLGRVKEGKEKYRFGFGGQGLSKLDEARDSHRSMERKAYGEDGTGSGPTGFNGPNGPNTESPPVELSLPEFSVIEGRAAETTGPDRCKFHSRVTINDLPQKARWFVVSADNLSEISDATSVSITNKGQFYASGRPPTTIRQGGREVPAPPKLYLLVEGLTESAVADANRMIRQKMIQGLQTAARDEPSGRYTV